MHRKALAISIPPNQPSVLATLLAPFETYPLSAGVLLVPLTLGIGHQLPDDWELMIHAVLFTAIASVYPVLAKASDARLFETMAAVIAFGIAAKAVLDDSKLPLAGGYILHAAWDMFHHYTKHLASQNHTPAWYYPFCVAYDVALAIALCIEDAGF